MIDRERLARCARDQGVPAQRRARAHEALAQELPGGRGVGGRAGRARLARERPVELGGRDLAEQVVVVVDRRQRDMELAGPVVGPGPGRRRDALVPLDELPPERAEILIGVAVQLALEARHHLHPGGEDEHLAALHLEVARVARDLGRDAREALEERLVAHEAAVQHRDRLGRERVRRLPQDPRQLGVDREGVGRVPELVHHRPQPARARFAVREHPHVVAPVDVGAERVLILAGARVQIAARQHGVDVVAERLEVGARGLTGSMCAERRVQRIVICGRQVLEERVGVIPGMQRLARGEAEPLSLCLIDGRLGALPGRREPAVEIVEQPEQPDLVELVERQGEDEVIAIAERAGRLVAQVRELAHEGRGAGRRSPSRRPRPGAAARGPDDSRRIFAISLSLTSRPPILPRWRENSEPRRASASMMRSARARSRWEASLARRARRTRRVNCASPPPPWSASTSCA